MRVLVPFDAATPKTRLKPVLNATERKAFAKASLRDVTATITQAGHTPEVLTTAQISITHPITVTPEPLTPAVNDWLERTDRPVGIVMADLSLVTVSALEQLFATAADIVLAPGRGGGTNAIVTRHPDFRVDYHDLSLRDHRHHARARELTYTEVDSYRLGTDIDTPADLIEVLLHTDRRTAAWLREHGITIQIGETGPEISRDDR